MAIKILSPKPGANDQSPTFLPRQFIAYGQKERSDRPIGILTWRSDTILKAHTGRTIVPKTAEPNPVPIGETEWAILFDLPRVPVGTNFNLSVFNAEEIPDSSSDATMNVQTVNNLQIAKKIISKSEDKRAKKLFVIPPVRPFTDFPTQNDTLRVTDPQIAYGTLVADNTDIDGAQSMFIDSDNPMVKKNPSWIFVENSLNFWAAYFDDLAGFTDFADLKIVYSPYGDVETTANIPVTT